MPSFFLKSLSLFAFLLFATSGFSQCPDLENTSTLTSPDCTNGNTPCDVCPGDVITLTASGTDLEPGSCVNWYYGTSNNFNPYNGEGTLLGCAMIETVPPNSCDGCPLTLGLYVDACGTEENNEFLVLYSGSGFYVDELSVDFDGNNNGGGGNDDIGGGCSWQTPSTNAINSIQSICTGSNVVGVGPGDPVPPGVPVIIFTSAGYDFNYNFGSLCPFSPTIYVMQNGCTRTIGAFSNGGSGGTRSTTVSVSCGCSQTTTYNTANLSGNDGDFVTDAGFPPFYGNVGCGFPNFPGLPSNPDPPVQVVPLDVTITQDMCNGGPYYAVGIVEPLPPGCTETFTNYLSFDVPCPDPMLSSTSVCANGGLLDLTSLQDPGVPNGVWSGPGVLGTNFDPFGQSGTVQIEFLADGPCANPAQTTVTVLTAPTASITPIASTCPGDELTLFISFTGQAPFTFDLFENGSLLGSFTTVANPFDIQISPIVTSTYSVENFSDNLCSGSDASFTVQVSPAPSATLSLLGGNSICQGDSVLVELNIAGGVGPYDFVYTIDNIPQGNQVTNENPHNFYIPLNDTSDIALLSLSANNCPATVAGGFTVNTTGPLSAVISGGAQICQGGSGTDLTVTFSGDGPYTFTYTADGILQPAITTSDNPYVFNVNPSSGTIYKLASLNNGVCDGAFSGTAVVFVFTPSTAVISGDQTVCDSASTTVEIDFTGTGPFTIVWAVDGVAQPPIDTFEDPFYIPVNVDSTTIYTLVSIQSPGCIGNVDGSATITVNYAPTYSNFNILCDPANNNYTVEFDVEGATDPLDLVAGNGSFANHHFISDPIHQDSAYYIAFADANLCDTIVVAGPSICNCITDAGSMSPDTVRACLNDTITALFTGGEILDGSDSLRYIVHSNPGLPIGQIFAWNDVPEFGFQPGMLVGTTYFISAIAGDAVGADSINLSDPCLSIAQGTPIVFDAYPQVQFALGDSSICTGENIMVPVQFAGIPPFAFVYAVDGVDQAPIGSIPTASFDLQLSPVADATYTLVSVSDAYCAASATDTIEITVNTVPQITNVTIDCDLQTQSYTIDFDITGGEAPYTVTGLSGTLTGNHFTSDVFPSSQDYSFVLTDPNGCGQDSIGGTVVCNCFTAAGTMDQTLIDLCPGEQALAIFNNDGNLDSDDSLIYVLHTNPGTSLGTILAFNNSPVFDFLSGQMNFGTVYYISSIAATAQNGMLDLADPCLSVSQGTPVVWHPAPTATMDGAFDICPGETQLLSIGFTGTAPYNFSYTQNGALNNNLALGNSFSINTTLLVTTEFILQSVSDAFCPGTVMGSAIIRVHGTPSIENLQVDCDPNNLNYSVSFDVDAEDLTDVQIQGGLTGNYDDASGSFTSDPQLLPLPFTVVVTDSWQCGQDSLTQTPNCSCSSFAGDMGNQIQNVCEGSDITFSPATGSVLDGFDELHYILCADPAILPAGILDIQSSPDFTYDPGWTVGQTLYVAAIVGNPLATTGVDFNDPCFSISNFAEATIRAIPTATVAGDTSICTGSNFNFPVLFTGAAPFSFSYSINGGNPQPTITAPQSSFAISTNNVQQSQVFTLVFVEDAFCPGTVNGQVSVTVAPEPEIQLSGDVQICPGGFTNLTISLQNADSIQFDLVANPGGSIPQTGINSGSVIQVNPAVSTQYSIQNMQVFGNACPFNLDADVLVELNPLNAGISTSNYNGFGLSCAGADDGSSQAIVSGGFEPNTILWNTGQSGAEITDLTSGTYSYIVTDAIGCTATAGTELTEPLPLDFAIEVTDTDCEPGSTGQITILSVNNANGAVSAQVNSGTDIAISGLPFDIDNLPAGDYELVLTDANGCTGIINTEVWSPDGITIDLEPAHTIQPGDSVLLDPQIQSAGITTYSWTPTIFLQTPGALQTYAKPEETTEYTLVVQDNAGCIGEATVLITLEEVKRVFIPNVLLIDAGDNGFFTVYGGSEVARVTLMQVYDRWGALMYEGTNLAPNNPGNGWDGFWKNKPVQPGVYPYIIEVEYQTGETEVFTGGLTVVR